MEPWIQTYTGKRFTPLDPKIEDIDIEDIAHALSNLCRYTGHCKQFYCVTPETKILTADLIWKKAEDLKLFEELLGFDENNNQKNIIGANNREVRRKLSHSYVKHTGKIKRHVFALHLSNGDVLKSSKEHPWLVCSKKSRNQKWESTENIISAIKAGKQRFMLKFLNTWKLPDSDFNNGYLSGIFDGEGTISIQERIFTIAIAQNDGIILNKIKELLLNNNITFTQIKTEKKCINLQLTGKWFEKLQFLGKVRPFRLLDTFKNKLRNDFFNKEFDSIEMLSIIKIEDLGMQDVIALETSSKTYFAEGFGAHNSVAQHSVFVSNICDDKYELYGLLHDGSEAFLNDISTPLKMSPAFAEYRKYEDKLSKLIYNKYGLSATEPFEVKRADKIALATEAKTLLDLRPDWKFQDDIKALDIVIEPLSPVESKKLFLDRFYELYER